MVDVANDGQDRVAMKSIVLCTVAKIGLARGADNDSQQSRSRIFLTILVVSFCGVAGLFGRVGGKVGLTRGLRYETSLK